MPRIDNLKAQEYHVVDTHKRGYCNGCSACQRNNSGRGGKGTALRLAAKLQDPQDQVAEETPDEV